MIKYGIPALALIATVMVVTSFPQLDMRATAQSKPDEQPKEVTPKPASWSAAAPGRVEPRNGMFKLNASMVGRVEKVWVKVGEKVVEGQPLIKIDDSDLLSRLRAADADVEARKKNRSTSGNQKIKRRRDAEDDLETAQIEVEVARRTFDELADAETPDQSDLSNAASRLRGAEQRVITARAALRDVINEEDAASPTTGELALTSARAQRDLALAALDRTRLRAPQAGTVLDINIKQGEIISPQMREPVILLGDLSALRVKAEVDERDVAEVRTGQQVLVRADAFSGRDFKGTVKRVGKSLTSARLGGRDVQRPANARVLEVLVDIESGSPLLPGMEVDVLFLSGDEKPAAEGSATN